MNRAALLRSLQPFKGRQIIDVADQVRAVAAKGGFWVNVTDPSFNTKAIDREPGRLNVHTDAQSVITSFSFG